MNSQLLKIKDTHSLDNNLNNKKVKDNYTSLIHGSQITTDNPLDWHSISWVITTLNSKSELPHFPSTIVYRFI